jgi:hypothetical protein
MGRCAAGRNKMPGGVVESLEANERELVHVGKAAL